LADVLIYTRQNPEVKINTTTALSVDQWTGHGSHAREIVDFMLSVSKFHTKLNITS